MLRTHDGSHGSDCFGCRIQSVSFAASAMPTRKVEAVRAKATEKSWTKDHAAYRRLRKEGLQPKSSKGAAEIEIRASSKFEVESGRIIQDQSFTKRIDQTQTEVKKEMASQ